MASKKIFSGEEIAGRLPAKTLSTLLKVSSALATSLNLKTVLQTAIESAVEVMGLETGAIYTLEGDWLFLGAATPPLSPQLRHLLTNPESLDEHPHMKRTLSDRHPVWITDVCRARLSPAEADICAARQLKSLLFIPLLVEDKPVGAIIVGSTSQARDYSEEEIDLCRILSYQIALAVANARLFRSVHQANVDLTQAYEDTLLGWSLALEMRDQETQGHTQRVTEMALELSRKMGLPEESLAHIRRGALLHDIGKMSIPDSILKKPGPLDEAEKAIMHGHPEQAYQFLLNIDYLLPALDIPYCHHEHWDGSGYPRGLKGEEIPLSARIFAVVDVFDALTSDRPYCPAWDQESALAYLREKKGIQFDPQVVDVFIAEVVKPHLPPPAEPA